MIIKSLTTADTDKIVSLEEESFADGWNKNMILSAFNGGRFFALGYFDNDCLVSFVSYSVTVDTADIETVCTKKEYRKQGLAKSLITKAERDIKEKNINKIFLEVREQNESAIALYKECGFINVSKRNKYYPDGETALVFCKEF